MKIILAILTILLSLTFAFANESGKAKQSVSKNFDCLTELKAGNFAKAIEQCSALIKADPSNSEVYYLRGTAYRNLAISQPEQKSAVSGSLSKNVKLAVADFKKCISLEQKNPRCYSAAGVVLAESEYDVEALEAVVLLTEAMSLGDKDDELYFYRAEAERNSFGISGNKDEEAIEDYTTFLQSNPTESSRFAALYARSLVYLRTRKFDKAVADLDVLAKETVDEELVYLNRGKAYNELGKYSLALADLNKALQLHDKEQQPQFDPKRSEILSEIEQAKKGGGTSGNSQPKPDSQPKPNPPSNQTNFELSGNMLKLPKPIVFMTASDKINLAESLESLNLVKDYLTSKTYITVMRIEAHAKRPGSEASLQTLTENRALAVANWLVANGIDCRRILPVGFGSTKPIFANDSPEASKNIRIEFHNAELRNHSIGGMPLDGGGKVVAGFCKENK